MKKTLLLPTDFSLKSLQLLKSVLQTHKSIEDYRILMVHGFYPSDSIRDLLFFSKTKQIDELTTAEFREGFKVLQNKFNLHDQDIQLDLFSGINRNAFQQYLEVNEVEKVYLHQGSFQAIHSQSFDLTPYILKSKIPFTRVELEVNMRESEGKIASILLHSATIN